MNMQQHLVAEHWLCAYCQLLKQLNLHLITIKDMGNKEKWEMAFYVVSSNVMLGILNIKLK